MSKVSPNALSAIIGVFALIAVAAFVFSIMSLKTSVDQSADRAATRAAAEAGQVSADAARRSLCRLMSIYLPKPGSAPPSTQRGREIVADFQAEYDALSCATVMVPARPSVTPSPR